MRLNGNRFRDKAINVVRKTRRDKSIKWQDEDFTFFGNFSNIGQQQRVQNVTECKFRFLKFLLFK